MIEDKSSRMLLVMAHRGEAQAFLKQGAFERREFFFDHFYQSPEALLLITGEGAQAAAEKTAAVCGAFRNQLGGVINYGLAGALDEACQIGEIHSIRTVYRDSHGVTAFRSYTSADKAARTDCITAAERVLTAEEAARLAPFAGVVDRELWSIASVCRLFGLPFYAYKLVSDIPGRKKACDDVLTHAEAWSRQMWRHYRESGAGKRPDLTPPVRNLPPGFYLTASQQRQFHSLLHSLALKWQLPEQEVIERLPLEKIIADQAIPKKRTAQLLKTMQRLLNPFQAALERELNALCAPLTAAGCTVTFARDYESDEIQLHVKIGHPRHLEQLQAALEQFDYPAVIRVLNGGLTEKISEENPDHVS